MISKGTAYDSTVLQEHVDRLYDEAANMIVWCALQYGTIAAIAATLAFMLLDYKRGGPSTDYTLVILSIGVIGGIIGGMVGKEKGFKLRLQAQMVLCQMQIQYNTNRESGYGN